MAVSISAQGDTLAIGATTVRAQHEYFGGATANYSVAPDGRVLMVRLDPSPVGPNRLIVVQDWLAQVTRMSERRPARLSSLRKAHSPYKYNPSASEPTRVSSRNPRRS